MIKRGLMAAGIVILIDWLIFWLVAARDWIDPAETAYHGGKPILEDEDALKLQARLAELLGEKEAAIVQKFREWTEVNRRDARNSHGGYVWTYGSYRFWHEKHFSWFSERWFKELIRKLEQMGVIISCDDAPFLRRREKAYRVDELRLDGLLNHGEESSQSWGRKFPMMGKKVPHIQIRNQEKKTAMPYHKQKHHQHQTRARSVMMVVMN